VFEREKVQIFPFATPFSGWFARPSLGDDGLLLKPHLFQAFF
jgi:hypothetical protein